MWTGYILMQMIVPPRGGRNAIVRAGEVGWGEMVGELGVFGVALWEVGGGEMEGEESKGFRMRINREAGWLLRTKDVESEEGGVAAGFGCVDSVVLVG